MLELTPDGSDTPPQSVTAPTTGQSRYVHSNVYDKLVRDDDDLTGLIAYGLYQKRKRQWIVSFEADRKRTPNEQEVKDYCYTYQEGVLSDLRSQAESLMFGVSEEIVADRVLEMQEEAFNARTTRAFEQLNTKIAEISGYKHHIIGHLAGFIVLVLLAWFVTQVLKYEPSVAHMFDSPSESPPLATPAH